MKKIALTSGLLILAGIFSFLFALNTRTLVMMFYRRVTKDPMMLGGSLLNAVTIILSMLLWIVYIFYLQHRLETKCGERGCLLRTILVFILPAPILYAASEIIIRAIVR